MPEETVYFGIDPSINSTGIAFYDGSSWKFFRLAPHFTKAELKAELPGGDDWRCGLLSYEKIQTGTEYRDKEYSKTCNFVNITDTIYRLVRKLAGSCVAVLGMEGVAYGSAKTTSAIFDLAGLNYLLRAAFIGDRMYMITPSELKKYATGKGNADKDLICAAFSGLFPEISALKKYDDMADAFFLANIARDIYRESLII